MVILSAVTIDAIIRAVRQGAASAPDRPGAGLAARSAPSEVDDRPAPGPFAGPGGPVPVSAG